MDYRRQGPSGLLVMLIAAAIVFGGYFLYTGAVDWFQRDLIARETATREAQLTQTELSIVEATRGFMPFPTNTPVPDCDFYYVNVSSAWVRTCPSLTCEAKDNKRNQIDVCVLGRAASEDFPIYNNVEEWFIIDLNEGLVFPDLGYMHESVLESRNPTPRPSATFTPAPTITLTPSPSLPTPTPAPGETYTPTPDDLIEF